MKNLALVLMAFAIVLGACEPFEPTAQNCSVKGRWVVMGSTLYQYTDSFRYTIYSVDGNFGTLADAIPGRHAWSMSGDTLVEDLNGGNISKKVVDFDCDCQVMNLSWESMGQRFTQKLWKEGFDTATCR
jgi:hypothetical protein